MSNAHRRSPIFDTIRIMKEEYPLVSIALCSFNGERYIRQQLTEIVNQDYQNIEVVISDDCSTDNTLLVVNEFIQKYDFITLNVNASNLGLVKNFEKAIDLCKGDYIALSDQDDIWNRSKIRELVDNVGENVLIYHDSSFIDGEGNPLTDQTMASRNVMYEGGECLPFIYSNCVSGHAIMFHRQLVPFVLPFDVRFFHDWWIVYVALNRGSIKYLNKVLVQYRQHGDNITDPLRMNTPHPGIEDFPINEEWVGYCSKYSMNANPFLIEETQKVVDNVLKGKKKLKSFLFLMKYFDLLFYIAKPPQNPLEKIKTIKKIVFKRY